MYEPNEGDLVEIHWPNGPYDFTIRFLRLEQVKAPGWEDWVVLRGMVVKPEGPQHQVTRSFYAHLVAGRYEMLPLTVG